MSCFCVIWRVGMQRAHVGLRIVPPIFIASFAMQESSCNPNTVGGGGEKGLMQLNEEKCRNAPGGNCLDVDYNIATGAAYFAQRLKDHGGNVLLALAGYNGWFASMTYVRAFYPYKNF